MSYASVASHNAPPLSQQPIPDPALLNTSRQTAPTVADDMSKVGVVDHDFRSHPATITGESSPLEDDLTIEEDLAHVKGSAKRKGKAARAIAKDDLGKAEREGAHLWAITKEQLLRPGVAGGVLGLVNVGLLSWASYALYTRPTLRRDTAFLGSAAASAFVLFGAEGYAAERYAKTPRGKDEKRRAEKEGAIVYRKTREIVLRPGVLGGLVGFVNVGILGTVGYFAYTNWEKPTWDRRVVSAISVGLLTLWGGEGYLAEQYSERRH